MIPHRVLSSFLRSAVERRLDFATDLRPTLQQVRINCYGLEKQNDGYVIEELLP